MGKKDKKNGMLDFNSVPRYEVESAIKHYNETKSNTDYAVAKAKYLMKRVEYEIRMIKLSDGKENDNGLGLGFVMAYDEFNDKDTLDFFASEMIQEIIKEDGTPNLEDFLHAKYPDKKPTDVRGTIVGTIAEHDVYLGIYVRKNLHVLETLEKQLPDIMKNWDKYISNEAEVIEDITNGFINYKDECPYSVIELLIYLKHTMNIDILKKVGIDTSDDILSEDEYYEFTFGEIDPKDEEILAEYRKLIKDYLKTRKEPDFYVLTEQAKKQKEQKGTQKNKIDESKLNNSDNENK